eukprot:TRINITY_DN4417_c1_g1_i9.p1 TRINITY_DN4417_c1_g1~~TRINITY_DN4417_c1_g1_i9.p1  ORF type:complete len:146 (-),score=11.01 TRINITY_DN4417_c1_g1_i9:901-1338(-)
MIVGAVPNRSPSPMKVLEGSSRRGPLLDLVEKLTPPSTPPRGMTRSNSDHCRWTEICSNSEDLVDSLSALVFYSISLEQSPSERRRRSRTDPWCRFNSTLKEDLDSTLTLAHVRSFLINIVEKLHLELEIQVMVNCALSYLSFFL